MGLLKKLKRFRHKREKEDVDYDAYLFSFPKCGRTWLTLQLGRVFQRHFELADANPIKLRQMGVKYPQPPAIRIKHDDNPHRKAPGELNESKEAFRGEKIIFMVRDPRDVLVSQYFQRSKREQDRRFWFFQKKRRATHGRFEGSLSEFLDVRYGGFDTILRYYNIWAANRDVPAGFLLVRYEDMHEDPHRELRRALDFLGVDGVSDEVVDDAVEFTAFDRMQQMEAEDAFDSFKLRPHSQDDKDSFKVRRGVVGGYADYLSDEEVESLNRRMAETLSPYFRYEPSAGEEEREASAPGPTG